MEFAELTWSFLVFVSLKPVLASSSLSSSDYTCMNDKIGVGEDCGDVPLASSIRATVALGFRLDTILTSLCSRIDVFGHIDFMICILRYVESQENVQVKTCPTERMKTPVRRSGIKVIQSHR
jgi:hypothetical protein